MKKQVILAAVLTGFMIASICQASEKTSKLGTEYTLTLGQVVAVFMNGVVDEWQKLGKWDAPVIISYNKEKDVIVMLIFGARSSVDGAKKSLDEFMSKVLAPMLVLVKKAYQVTLDESDYKIVYVNRITEKPVIQRVDGKNIIP